jgi:hypothetical protein
MLMLLISLYHEIAPLKFDSLPPLLELIYLRFMNCEL